MINGKGICVAGNSHLSGKPVITLAFPHAVNPWNDACLRLKLAMLHENTTCQWEVLYVPGATADEVYPAWNHLFSIARSDIVVWDNTDLLYARNWNESILRHLDDADWLCLRPVECGAIGSAYPLIQKDFGRTAETFRREEFERFCEEDARGRKDIEPGKFGWYAPSAFKRQWFMDMGMFDCSLYPPFPYPVDIKFREKVTARQCRYATVASYAAHLQFARENMGEITPRIQSYIKQQ